MDKDAGTCTGMCSPEHDPKSLHCFEHDECGSGLALRCMIGRVSVPTGVDFLLSDAFLQLGRTLYAASN